MEGEFEFGRLMRVDVLPRAASLYDNHYRIARANTVGLLLHLRLL